MTSYTDGFNAGLDAVVAFVLSDEYHWEDGRTALLEKIEELRKV